MINWKEFFQKYRIVDIKNDNDLLFQVGTTVGGKPISPEQFSAIVDSLTAGLNLQKNDSLLDLCCGNGVITHQLADKAGYVAGIDISAPYIDNAIKFKKKTNIEYFHSDVTDGPAIIHHTGGKTFNKISLYASLAYLTPPDLEKIMTYLNTLSPAHTCFMIGSILDQQKKWNFFNTFRRRVNYIFKYWLWGRDFGLGRWWSKAEISLIARKYGYTAEFREQNSILHTAHYRFDVILTRNSSSPSITTPRPLSDDIA